MPIEIEDIPVDRTLPDPEQPRKTVCEKDQDELEASWLNLGQLDPTIVFKHEDMYAIVDGWRRWLVAKRLKLTHLRAVVLDKRPTASDLLNMQLAVNCARTDLSPMELCDAYKRFMEIENIKATEVAKRVGKSKSYVAKVLTLSKLPPELQQMLRDRKLGLVAAYKLSQLDSKEQEEAVRAYFGGSGDNVALEQVANTPIEAVPVRNSRVQCELEQGSVSIRAKEPLSLEALQAMLESLIRSVRKARKEGYDLTAFSHALRCRAKVAEGTKS